MFTYEPAAGKPEWTQLTASFDLTVKNYMMRLGAGAALSGKTGKDVFRDHLASLTAQLEAS